MQCDAQGKILAINLPKNNLSGTLPSNINALADLHTLNLANNHLKGVLGRLSIVPLPALKVLLLEKNPLSEKIPPHFFIQHRHLQELNLSSTELFGTLPESFAALSELKYASLDHNFLIETLPQSLLSASFSELKFLKLAGNYIARLQTSPVYLQFKNRFPALKEAPQYRIAFVGLKGEKITKLPYLKPHQEVRVRLIQEVWRQGKYLQQHPSSLKAVDRELKFTNLRLIRSQFPEYTLQLENPDQRGELEVRLKALGAYQGKNTSASLLLSTQQIEEDFLPESPQLETFTNSSATTGLHFEL